MPVRRLVTLSCSAMHHETLPLDIALQAAKLLQDAKLKYETGDKLQAAKIYEDVMFAVCPWTQGIGLGDKMT